MEEALVSLLALLMLELADLEPGYKVLLFSVYSL